MKRIRRRCEFIREEMQGRELGNEKRRRRRRNEKRQEMKNLPARLISLSLMLFFDLFLISKSPF
jgi:hypothetical protein